MRTRLGDILDAALPPPFERTAVNGFGFVQIVRPGCGRRWSSGVHDRVATAALTLLRHAERAPGPGSRVLTAAPAVVEWLAAMPALTAELERRCGAPVRLQAEPGLAISAGHVARVSR